jgi:hypothetical protein
VIPYGFRNPLPGQALLPDQIQMRCQDVTYQNQLYYRKRIFRPYIGLRILKVLQGPIYINYIVTNASPRENNIIMEATVERISFDGNIIPNSMDMIMLMKYVRTKNGVVWEFTDRNIAITGIANENGELICTGTNIGNFNRK